MREILPNQLWIGNAGDGRAVERLLEAGVAAIVSVAAALAILEGGDPEEKLKEIATRQPHDVSPYLWEAVCLTRRRGVRGG